MWHALGQEVLKSSWVSEQYYTHTPGANTDNRRHGPAFSPCSEGTFNP